MKRLSATVRTNDDVLNVLMHHPPTVHRPFMADLLGSHLFLCEREKMADKIKSTT